MGNIYIYILFTASGKVDRKGDDWSGVYKYVA